MQTILGAGGAIGKELANALTEYTREIRLVSRNPKKINESDEVFQADLLNAAQVLDAVNGSSVVYLTAGLPYTAEVWKRDWPVIMANVINACTKHNARLVFFDNMYMYDPSQIGNMTERTPVKPSSDKGKVRAQINQMIFDEMDKGKLSALIARSADYYGPGDINTSMLSQTVIQPLKNGKKANWMGGVNYKHSMTYTVDAGKATALLGNTPDAFNQVWHLPTAPDPLTGKQWIDAIANELSVKPNFQVASKLMVRGLGLFMPIMKEMVEMYYQYDRDYVFNSTKFENRFSFKPTPYEDGIKAVTGK